MTRSRLWQAAWIALLATGCASPRPPAAAELEAFEPERHAGVWVSRGYGYVLDVEDGRVRLFHLARGVCVEETELDSSILPHLDLVRPQADGRRLMLSSVRDPYEYVFERVDALAAACQPPTPDTPEANFEAFAAYFAEHYAFFDLYGVDWAARVAEARPSVTNGMPERELFELMRKLVLPLKDSHLKLEAEIDGQALVHDGNPGRTEAAIDAMAHRRGIDPGEMVGQFRRTFWFEGIGNTLLEGKGTVAANGRIQYGMIGRDVGYVAFVTMGGYVDGDDATLDQELPALDAVMEDALALFASRHAKALIVDLSLNTGGYDFIGAAIAGRFAASSVVAYTKRPGDASGTRDFAISVEPAAGARYTGPVYVLTSDMTRSAAEVLTLSMRALDNVRHVGEPTRGSFSTVLDKCLPNGWCLSLSNEIYTGHDGQVWEGRGIEPDVKIPVFDRIDPMTGHLDAVRTVVALIDGEVRARASR